MSQSLANNKNRVVTANGETFIEGRGIVLYNTMWKETAEGQSSKLHACLPFTLSQDYLLD